MEESLVIFVLNVELCSILHEKVDHTHVSLFCGYQQRCEAVHVTQLGVRLSAAKLYTLHTYFNKKKLPFK